MEGYSGRVGENVPQGLRLDRYVAEYLRLLSRSQIKAKNLAARINGKSVKISRRVKAGDLLELSWAEAGPADILPENLPLEVIYEDGRVVVINKAQGMVVHPGAGNHTGTLANALLYRRLERGREGEGFRPGIVHRLDKDTSGVIIAAYDDEALAFLAEQFKARKTRKIYAALVTGIPPEHEGVIETFIARDSRDRKKFAVSPDTGKAARTGYRVVRAWKGYSLLLLRPRTGRTHQLRVHLKHLGCPILGDPLYGKPDIRFPRAALMLHARSLSLVIPGPSGRTAMGEYKTFRTPLPGRFRELLGVLP
ncbi:MAG: RluA family pseudouridine synthase, partial [Treponema sp.]|nr:RluA family pseudouridine synthase [Treponema sp.]